MLLREATTGAACGIDLVVCAQGPKSVVASKFVTDPVISITAEVLTGAHALSLADGYHFELNLADLLDKSTQCKSKVLGLLKGQSNRAAIQIKKLTHCSCISAAMTQFLTHHYSLLANTW